MPPEEREPQGERRIWIVLEDIFIVASVFSLWPMILGWQGIVWEYTKYVAAIGLVIIFLRRMRRYQVKKDLAQGGNES